MTWKSIGVLVATLAFCTSLMAQRDPRAPFLGIWEINLAKSPGYPPQQGNTIVNAPTPDGGFDSTRITTEKGNMARIEVHPVLFDGTPHQTSGGDPREITYKLIDPNTVERTHNRAGKIAMDTEQVSKDGKTLTVTQANAVRVYDKKFSLKEVGR
jgi:hypothetical protein